MRSILFNSSLNASRVSCPMLNPGLEFLFQEQSYSSLHSGRSLACDHFRGDIDYPCGVIADFCGVIAYPCGVGAIPEAICAIADRCATR